MHWNRYHLLWALGVMVCVVVVLVSSGCGDGGGSSTFGSQKAFFSDNFNRTTLGTKYAVLNAAGFGLPVLNGNTFGDSDPNVNAAVVVTASAAAIKGDQFARAKLVNVSSNGVSSLYLRMTLSDDKSTRVSGYMVDFGRMWDNSADWWTVYYKDPVSGWQILHDETPSAVSIPVGAIAEMRAAGNNLQVVVNGQVIWSTTHQGVATGAPGISVYGDSELDDFAAGDYPN